MKTKKKGFTLVEIMIVVVIIGLLATMAIPAFRQVRTNAQTNAVKSNLRQLASAADQYFIEHGGTTVGVTTSLVGPGKYIKALNIVAQETYPITITAADTLIATTGTPIVTIQF